MVFISSFPILVRRSDSTKLSQPSAADNGAGTKFAANLRPMASSNPANVLPLEGEIDLHVSPRVERALASIIKKRPAHVVVDLSAVRFIDSSGLAVLIRAMQHAQKYGARLSLSGINDRVRPIYKMERIDQ